MKTIKLALKRIFFKEKVNGIPESNSVQSHDDFVKLVWMIEKLRHPENKCTMNELVREAQKNFHGLESIQMKQQ